jgi:hypothetical protein
VNGVIGETLVIAIGLNGLAPWVLGAYAVRRGWRVNTSPEKPKPPQNTAAPAEMETPAGAAVPAGANGAAAG